MNLINFPSCWIITALFEKMCCGVVLYMHQMWLHRDHFTKTQHTWTKLCSVLFPRMVSLLNDHAHSPVSNVWEMRRGQNTGTAQNFKLHWTEKRIYIVVNTGYDLLNWSDKLPILKLKIILTGVSSFATGCPCDMLFFELTNCIRYGGAFWKHFRRLVVGTCGKEER